MGRTGKRQVVRQHPYIRASRVAAALIPAIFALLVLAGWFTRDQGLKHLWLSRVTMNPLTAVCFLCLSASLGLRVGRQQWANVAAAALITFAAATGGLILIDDVFGGGVRPDRLLFASQLVSVGGRIVSRMAPNAALCLVLTGIALAFLARRTRRAASIAQGLAVAVAAIAGFAVVGHLYSVTPMYSVGAFFPMAAHSALAFIAISVYILLTSRRGPAAMLADHGAAGAVLRRLLPATVAVPVLVGAIGVALVKRGILPGDMAIALTVIVNVLAMTSLLLMTGARLFTADRRWRRAERALLRLARTDWLTGLPNRARFMEQVMQRMSPEHRRSGDMFAVVYMDLDGFKAVNDTLGHAAGDKLLQDVAVYLRTCLRPGDIIARLGGDEFTMLLDRIAGPLDATSVAARIVDGMPRSVTADGHTVPVGISVGLVISEPRHVALEELLHEADQALYRAKRDGRGRFSVFTPQSLAA